MVTERERDLLLQLRDGQWETPLYLGGHSRSHHSSTLQRMAKRSLVERAYRHGDGTGICRPSYKYRITATGLTALGEETE